MARRVHPGGRQGPTGPAGTTGSTGPTGPAGSVGTHSHLLAEGATDVTATVTEVNYIDGVTSPVQDQLNSRPVFLDTITGVVDTTSIDLTMAPGAGAGNDLTASAIFGVGAGTVAEGNHAHAGTYQPLDPDLTDLAGKWWRASAVNPAGLQFAEDTDNGIHVIELRGPASASSDKVQSLQDAAGTVALTSDISALSSVYQPLDSDLTTIAGLTATTDNVIQSVASAWASRTPAQLKTTLALVSSDVGLGNVTNDAQLKISSNLSDLNNAATARGNLGVAIGTNVQAWDAFLDDIAAMTDPGEDQYVIWDDSVGDLVLKRVTKAIPITIGDGTNVPGTGIWTAFRMPVGGVWTKNSILALKFTAGSTGSIVIDIWKDTHANAPPTVADTITASAKPTLSAAAKSEDSTLTGWTTSFNAGDWFVVNIDSVATLTLATLSLEYREVL